MKINSGYVSLFVPFYIFETIFTQINTRTNFFFPLIFFIYQWQIVATNELHFRISHRATLDLKNYQDFCERRKKFKCFLYIKKWIQLSTIEFNYSKKAICNLKNVSIFCLQISISFHVQQFFSFCQLLDIEKLQHLWKLIVLNQ